MGLICITENYRSIVLNYPWDDLHDATKHWLKGRIDICPDLSTDILEKSHYRKSKLILWLHLCSGGIHLRSCSGHFCEDLIRQTTFHLNPLLISFVILLVWYESGCLSKVSWLKWSQTSLNMFHLKIYLVGYSLCVMSSTMFTITYHLHLVKCLRYSIFIWFLPYQI